MSETDAYFAGLIDGEGSILLHKRGPNRPGGLRPLIKVNMTDKAIIMALAQEYGGAVSEKKVGNPRWKPQWIWRVQNKAARETLFRIYPYLRVKREAANKLLVFFESSKVGRPCKAAAQPSSEQP